LAAEVLSATPVTNFTQTGVLRIRNSEGITNIPISFMTAVESGSWRVVYQAGKPGALESIMVVHQIGQPNQYCIPDHPNPLTGVWAPLHPLTPAQITAPFAGSDFSIADLGLEFFHWPEQKITGHETRRTRACTVLESDNPDPSAGGYSRVVTWIDNQMLGIIHAEAYDATNKLLKVFDPKSFKKVNGQPELQDIEIRNVQTHSRTWIRFDLSDNS
jgi:Outer membrane lipoprotein-sorting protein